MDGQKTTVEQVGMPLTSVNPEPRPFQQYVSDVPTGPKVTVRPAMVHLTRQSRRRLLRGNAIILAHILKVPEKEMIFAVNQKYSVIRDMAYNFDRTHEESFFESRPQLIIKADGDNQPTTADLRLHYRDYAARLATWYYYYETIQPKAIACLVSIMNLSRFNGQTLEKDIAGLARWSYINRNSGAIAQFPAPKGMTQILIDNARYAVGSNANGTTTLSIPLYDSTVYGNLGNHAGSLREYVAEINPDSVTQFGIFSANSIGDESPQDSQTKKDAKAFIQNEIRTVMDYYRVKGFDILNDSVLTINNDGDVMIQHLANDGKEHKIQDSVRGTSITDVLWENYKLWFTLLLNQFADMRDPTNDKRVLAQELGFIEEQMTPEKMMNAVRSQDLWSITSLRNVMRYRSNGKVNTATVVRSNLPFASMDMTADPKVVDAFNASISFTAPTVFEANFKRFKLYEGDAYDWVRSAKQYPGITPRVFADTTLNSTGSTQAPLVLGAISSDGDVFPVQQGFIDSGKFASFYDLATHNTIDPVGSNVELSAVSADDALRLTDQKEGFVLAEDPSQVFVPQSPIVDVSDPFQCGFFLVLANEKADVSDWAKFVRDPSSYASPIVEDFFNTVNIVDDTGILDKIPLVTSQIGYQYSSKQVKNVAPTNGNLPPYSLLFVGDMAFVPPEARSFLDAFAMPREEISSLNEPGESTPNSRLDAKAKMLTIIQAGAAAELYASAKYKDLGEGSTSVESPQTNYLPKVITELSDAEGNNHSIDVEFSQETGEIAQSNRVEWRPRFFLRPGPVYQNKVDGYKKFWNKIKYTATLDGDSGKGTKTGTIQMKLKSFVWETIKNVVVPTINVLIANTVARKFVPYSLQPMALAMSKEMTDAIIAALDGLGPNGQPDEKERAKWYFTSSDIDGDGSSGALSDYRQLLTTKEKVVGSNLSWWQSEDGEYMLGIEIPAAVALEHATDQAMVASVIAAYSPVSYSSSTADVTPLARSARQRTVKGAAKTAPLPIDGATFSQGGGMQSFALFRLAAKRNPGFANYFSGAVIEYTDSANEKQTGYDSAGFIANLMLSVLQTSAGKKSAVKLYMFNPQFGPIALITDPIPYGAGFGTDPQIDSTISNDDTLSVGALLPQLGNMSFDNGVEPDSTQRRSYRNTISAAHLWTWMLRSFSFNPVYTGSNGEPKFAGDTPIRFEDGVKTKWVTSLFMQCIVNYAGHGDVKYFNDKATLASQFDGIQAEKVSSYPVQDIITMPKKMVAIKGRDPLQITGKDRTTQSYSTGNSSDVYGSGANTSGDSQPNESVAHPRERRHKRRRSKGFGSKPQNSGYHDKEMRHERTTDDKYVPSTLKESSTSVREGSGFDASSQEVDSRVDRAAKRPMDPAKTQN